MGSKQLCHVIARSTITLREQFAGNWELQNRECRAKRSEQRMKSSESINLDALESRLEINAPRAYREFVQSTSAPELTRRGFDPKTLLVLNLELKELEYYENIRNRFFLNGDGCGNYYFVDLEGDEDAMLLWAHDPPGIEHPGYVLATYLRDAEQECRIDFPLQPWHLCICRTARHAESILNPISLEEWIDAVNSTEGVHYLGYREIQNPFKREAIRIEMPGTVNFTGDNNLRIEFRHGRAMLKDSPLGRPIAIALAQKLGANLLEWDSGAQNHGT
jgi:hypothetical protein